MTSPITETTEAVAHPTKTKRNNKPHALVLNLAEIESRLKGRGIQLIGEYRSGRLPATFKGKCGHYWRATAASVINSQTNCPVEDNPKFKIVVSVALYPDGVPVPDLACVEAAEVARVAVDCLADPHGVGYGSMQMALKQESFGLTEICACAMNVTGDALRKVALGDREGITGEEFHHYEDGQLVEVEKVTNRH
ncbi:hypothetical protein ID866_8096 [Astraeus odoratus]|nr:hypothetical protein ID866_8096 [Astraeus odoratus]